jgi:hypothetical protein
MAEIVEASLRKAGLFKEAVKLMRHDRPIQWVAVRPRKHQTPFLPIRSGSTPFCVLSSLMLAQNSSNHRRHHDRSTAPHGLWLDELKHSTKALQLSRNAEVAHFQVDILPT